MNHHELVDRGASCINPATEQDGDDKPRNNPRRRVPAAVSIPAPDNPFCPLTLCLV